MIDEVAGVGERVRLASIIARRLEKASRSRHIDRAAIQHVRRSAAFRQLRQFRQLTSVSSFGQAPQQVEDFGAQAGASVNAAVTMQR
jgi:hypothetical protein